MKINNGVAEPAVRLCDLAAGQPFWYDHHLYLKIKSSDHDMFQDKSDTTIHAVHVEKGYIIKFGDHTPVFPAKVEVIRSPS